MDLRPNVRIGPVLETAVVIRIAGVNHFDPLCRHKLLDWFCSCFNDFGQPNALATEWDEQLFSKVREQREHFANRLREAFPYLSPETVNTLKLSLGFEGDTHLDIFPDVEVLWLDQGRQQDVSTYAEDRLAMFKDFLAQPPIDVNDSNVLARLSAAARERAGGQEIAGGDRDKKFVDLLFKKMADYKDGYVIVVVGIYHTSQVEGSMRSLLERAGQSCEAATL